MPKYQDKTQGMIDRGSSPFKDEFFSSAWKELAKESYLQNARFLPPVKAAEKSNPEGLYWLFLLRVYP